MTQEAPSRMEPLLLDEVSPALADLAAEIAREAEALGGRLPPKTLASLADQVRIMNCYYSNLIEGHPTRPRDIDAALKGGGVARRPDREREELLQLALSHIRVQGWIDGLHAEGGLPNPASRGFVEEIHRRFYEGLPETFRHIRDPERPQGPVRRVMEPGRVRAEGEEVSVGEHVPPSGGDPVRDFLARFERCYGALGSMGAAQRLCAVAAAHHRFLYIHPFEDGNGRVARLVTHAMFLRAGYGASGLWSASRGLARGLRADVPHRPRFLERYAAVPPAKQYRMMMAHADAPRLGDLDGRGNLSRRRLTEFSEWFLAVCLDQLRFMRRHLSLDNIAERLVRDYAPRRGMRAEAGRVLAELARLGSLPRASVRAIGGVSARTATTIIRELLDDGIVRSDGPRGELALNFTVDAMETLAPGLFGVEALLADGA